MLEEYVGVLSRVYSRSTVVLFGSRARGESLPYSDYDIMVVLEEVGDKLSEAMCVYSLKPRPLPVDVVVVGVDELGDPIIMRMLSRGCVIIYDGLGLGEAELRVCRREG